MSGAEHSLRVAAVLHAVKNRLAELQLRLSAREGCEPEQALAADCARQLTALLLLGRAEQGQLQAHVDAWQPEALLRELAAEYAALYPQLRFQVETDAAPPEVFADAFLLRLALGNAVHNACRVARRRVTLSAVAEAAGCRFEVVDDGPGYPDALLRQPQTQPLLPTSGGTGLGLYLAARIAALHGLGGRSGRIALDNPAAGGARFRLHLP